ncbi:MAG: hypothetical protein IAE83_10455 [Anaerolinea sp.]|nr:hypothetical protein [Anaerolinea sp.]MCC6973786.1 hypothetical protein [Anaerolineae bacterium]CAG1005079.1 hypothetical protein ANRL4_03502 [Anaerolineae bacterium]
MSLNNLLSEIYDSFREHASGAKVTLIHAQSRYRTALLSQMLADPNLRVFYYAMGADDVDMRSFIAGFTHDISEQVPTFGTRVNQVSMDTPTNQERMVSAFADDLDNLSSAPFVLLLDEFDRADIADDLQSFLEQLITVLPSQCKLVLSGRGLPRLPWMSLIAQRQAVMLRDKDLIRTDFYANQSPESARMVISALGPGHVLLDNELIEAWEGHLPRLLFFFALERPYVTRSEICQAFWPELHSDQAVNVFHVTKRRLHKALDVLGMDVLVHESSFYRVNPALQIHYDVVDFVGALVDGRTATTPAEQLSAWQRAVDLHQYPFLQGHSEGWITRRRNEYMTGYIEALSSIADLRIADGRAETALNLLQRAVEQDSSRQDIHRRIMQLFGALGRRSEAAGHYQRLRDELKANGEIMEPETRTLYEDIIRNE